MSTFEEWMQKAVAPGQERLIPGAVVLAANKDGISSTPSRPYLTHK